jgi:Tfp pilus assembly protein PilO
MTNDRKTLALVALSGIAILAALWMLAIKPKREERAQVRENVAAQQTRLQAAQSQLAGYEASRKAFPAQMRELKRLDKAVPSRGAIADLLRQLQRRANVRHSDLRLVALKAVSGVSPTTGAPPVTPGASVGPDGLATLPFTFEFTGDYFDLRDILKTVRRSVSVHKNTIKVGGRLLTIDGLTFTRPDATSTQTKATLNATAYIAPDGASTPQPPAAPSATTAAPTAGGS